MKESPLNSPSPSWRAIKAGRTLETDARPPTLRLGPHLRAEGVNVSGAFVPSCILMKRNFHDIRKA